MTIERIISYISLLITVFAMGIVPAIIFDEKWFLMIWILILFIDDGIKNDKEV